MKICSAVKNKRRYPHLCAESKKTFAQGLNLIYQTTVSTVLLRLDDEVVRIVVGLFILGFCTVVPTIAVYVEAMWMNLTHMA